MERSGVDDDDAEKQVVEELRDEGRRVGSFRPVTLWPFPETALAEACRAARQVLVFEVNAGQMIDYRQIVTGRQMLGMWDPATGTHLKLPLSELQADGSNGAAILVQTDKDGLPGPILGAASVRL